MNVAGICLCFRLKHLPCHGPSVAWMPYTVKKFLGRHEQTDRACPLLVDHVCMVYEARPIICRTHGYPLYMEKEGRAMVDFCPKNFKGVKKLDRADMLDLDRMNTLLTAVNNHFIACFEDGLPDRIPVDQALELYQLL